MARPNKPLDQLSPNALDHDKASILKRMKAPKPVGVLGNASKWMNKDEKRIWGQLRKSAPGVLGENDRCLMEITVTLKDMLEKRTLSSSERATLIMCLTKLGLIVLDRAPVEQKTPVTDELGDLGV